MGEGVEEQGEVGIGGCEHGGAGGGVVEGGQRDHLACHILADLFLEFGNWKLLDDIFSSSINSLVNIASSNAVKLLGPVTTAVHVMSCRL